MPKMYFIGVTTASSSIHKFFRQWASLAGMADASLVGTDLGIDAAPACYRAAVEQILGDPEAMGALVTTHKVALWTHARDLFTDFDADAEELGEVSCIVRRGGRLAGLAVDPLTACLALRAIVGEAPFRGPAVIFGAGGAGLALASHLFRAHQPARVVLTDISPERLAQVRARVPAECRVVSSAEDHDRLLADLPDGSLIVNATGMGKDRPGAPITTHARFPRNAIAWDFNYRGELLFLDAARAQDARAVDGWEYFLHGWSQIMSRVFGFELTPELFGAMRAAADAAR
jgi:shikimate 5-dehydrogenase